MATPSTVLALTGPTAVGKTEVAMALADMLPVDLISMDSAMVYRGMNVGTAKPPPELLASYPHRLVDVRDPADAYSAADFVNDADAAVRDAWAHNRLPILVGGTMLYLAAFRDGLAPLPRSEQTVRAELEREADARGLDALHAELVRIDPDAAKIIHPNNPQRLKRALEVYRLSGRPISAFWAEQAETDARSRLGAELNEVAVLPDDRAVLAHRIELRFAAMLENGLIAEVEALRARPDLSLDLPALRAVGYKQVWEHLDGDYDRCELARRGTVATRRLAKRQLTWLRRWPWLHRHIWGDPVALARNIAAECCLANP